MPHLPALIVTLKNRTLSAPAERFIECARDVVREVIHRRRRTNRERYKPAEP